ncbi:g5397 [Coccomyxa elongata]
MTPTALQQQIGPQGARGSWRSWLEAQPELVHLERTLRLYLAGYPDDGDLDTLHAKGDLVLVRPGVAVPMHLHRGSPHEAVVLRAVPVFGAARRPAFDFVIIKAGDVNEELWFAQLRLVFGCMEKHRNEHRCAFVRWLCQADDAELPLQRLKWAETVSWTGVQVSWYDIIDIATIECPVLLQQDPSKRGFF